MGVLDFSLVNVALPSIQRMFHLTAADLQWLVSAYALMLDRKGVFMLGLGLFSLAGLFRGLAPSPLVILAARAVQGLGVAIVSPPALALLTTTFPEGSVAGIGFSVGVILGGMLTSGLSWRWVFFVNVPVGLLALLSAFPCFRLPVRRERLWI